MNAYQLPVRLVFNANRKPVIKGSEPEYGDAGWCTVCCADREDALRVMSDYPQARMPCWARIERGEC
jgi:hypothetical protein